MFTQEILDLLLQMASPQGVSSGKFSHEHHAYWGEGAASQERKDHGTDLRNFCLLGTRAL